MTEMRVPLRKTYKPGRGDNGQLWDPKNGLMLTPYPSQFFRKNVNTLIAEPTSEQLPLRILRCSDPPLRRRPPLRRISPEGRHMGEQPLRVRPDHRRSLPASVYPSLGPKSLPASVPQDITRRCPTTNPPPAPTRTPQSKWKCGTGIKIAVVPRLPPNRINPTDCSRSNQSRP